MRAPLLLVGAEPVDLLLRHTDQDDAFTMAKPREPSSSHVLLALVPLELNHGDPITSRERSDVPDEAVDPLLEQDRGRYRAALVLHEVPPQVLRSLERRHVAVQVQPVDAVDLERDVIAE